MVVRTTQAVRLAKMEADLVAITGVIVLHVLVVLADLRGFYSDLKMFANCSLVCFRNKPMLAGK